MRQLLSRFEREGSHLVVFEIGVEGKIPHPSHAICLSPLTFEITRVLDFEICRHERFDIHIPSQSCRPEQLLKWDFLPSGDLNDFYRLSELGASRSG